MEAMCKLEGNERREEKEKEEENKRLYCKPYIQIFKDGKLFYSSIDK
jgi:hypothetical protein